MPLRYKRSEWDDSFSLNNVSLKPKFFTALKEALKEGYSRERFLKDGMAGIIVGLVALPLAMALAIASGVAPQHGLYTVVIAGFLVALLGGSRLQVTGPTAAFVVILLPIVQKFGMPGLLTSGFLAGIMMLFMGLARMGQLIQFIPFPVTTGFTTGIAVVIASIQLKDFFGMSFAETPETFFSRLSLLARSVGTIQWPELLVSSVSLLLLIVWPKRKLSVLTKGWNARIPAPLIVLVLASFLAWSLQRFFGLGIATIGTRFKYQVNDLWFAGIPQTLPSFQWPWASSSENPLTFQYVESLMPSAVAIALLGAIESLLSAVVVDGMAQTQHDPDAELTALGIGNIICPFFGGIAATGALARTATNFRFGATSPISAMIHAAFVLLVILLFAALVSFIPMASLAALLLIVAYNMADLKHFAHILKVAPRADVAVLLVCFSLTVIFDMVVGVTVGFVLASLFFMNRMQQTATSKVLEPIHAEIPLEKNLPATFSNKVLVYEISGPMFFGAVQKAIASISQINRQIEVVVFDLRRVPAMDVTGLVALESSIDKLSKEGRQSILGGVQPQPAAALVRSSIVNIPHVSIHASVTDAIEDAKKRIL